MKRNGLHICVLAAASGSILGVAIILAVAASGQTFRQRCAKSLERGSEEWAQCVNRLAQGGEA